MILTVVIDKIQSPLYMLKQKVQYIHVIVKEIIMSNEQILKCFLDKALDYMEKDNVNSDTAEKYRAAASRNLLYVLKSLTKDDILGRLDSNPSRDQQTAAGLLEKFFKSQNT